jgi:hypothetical protein
MFYLVAKSSHVGADVDGSACSLQRPMVCSHQRGGQSFLRGVAPSYHVAVGGGVFPGDVKPLSLNILHCVDHPSTCKSESYIEKPAFTECRLI